MNFLNLLKTLSQKSEFTTFSFPKMKEWMIETTFEVLNLGVLSSCEETTVALSRSTIEDNVIHENFILAPG